MSILAMFAPEPMNHENLYNIVKKYFSCLEWYDIEALVDCIKYTTDYELTHMPNSADVVYEDYFEEGASSLYESLFKNSFSSVENLLINICSVSGAERMLYDKAQFEVSTYGWDAIPNQFFHYAMYYNINEYILEKNDNCEDYENYYEKSHFNTHRISNEKYLHRRHRAGHMKDVARHGWQGKLPRKWNTDAAWNYERKTRALNAVQKLLEEDLFR